MKANLKKIQLALFLLVLTLFGQVANAQTYNVYVSNDRLISSKVLEFDVWMVNTSGTVFSLRSMQYAIQFNAAFIPAGTITASYVAGSTQMLNYSPGSITWSAAASGFQVASNTGVACSNGTPVLADGTPLKLGSFRLTSTTNDFNCAPHNINLLLSADGAISGLALKTAVSKWNDITCVSGLSTVITTSGTYTRFVANTLYSQVSNSKPSIQTNPLPANGCAGSGSQTFTVGATGNGTSSQLNYQWLDNGSPILDGGSFSGATTPTLTISNPGAGLNGHLYSVQVSQCTPSLSRTSTAAALNLTTVELSPASGALAGGTVGTPYSGALLTSAGGTAPYGYTVTGGALPAGLTLSPSGAISGTPEGPAGPSSFTVTSTATGGCSGSATYSIEITGGACDLAGSGTTTPVTCNGNTDGSALITLTGSGALAPGTYTVDGGPSLPFATNPFTVPNLGAGNHTIVATVGACSTEDIVVNVATPVTFTATFVKTNVSACNATNDGTITVTPTGGSGNYSYAWTGVTGSGNPANTPYPNPGNVSSLTNLPIGFYNVTITDVGGCGVVTINNIWIGYAFTVYVTSNASISSGCGNTGAITLYGNAGVAPYSYSLTGGNDYQSTPTFTNLPAGTYTGYIKDGAGCVGTQTNIVVGAAAPIVVNPFTRAASSCAADGVIEIYRTGGVGPYTYSLDNITYQTSNTFTGKAAGSYTAYVKDSKGCVASAPATVAQGVGVSASFSKTNTSSCITDGTIQVYASGGVYPYMYSLNGGAYQSSNLFTGLAAGNYTIMVKDFKNCLSEEVNVTINTNIITVVPYVVNSTTCESNNGSIQLFRTGGVGPYTYSLDGMNYQVSNLFTNKAPGTYTGYVKDSKTCVGELEGIVVGPTNCAPPLTRNATNIKLQPVAATALKIQAYPNPSTTEFTLVLEGYDHKSKVSVVITDVMGRKVYQTEGTGKQQYKFGNGFIAGIYNVQVIQGTDKKSVKLVKE